MNQYVGEDGTLQSSSLSNEEEKEGGSGGGFYWKINYEFFYDLILFFLSYLYDMIMILW